MLAHFSQFNRLLKLAYRLSQGPSLPPDNPFPASIDAITGLFDIVDELDCFLRNILLAKESACAILCAGLRTTWSYTSRVCIAPMRRAFDSRLLLLTTHVDNAIFCSPLTTHTFTLGDCSDNVGRHSIHRAVYDGHRQGQARSVEDATHFVPSVPWLEEEKKEGHQVIGHRVDVHFSSY